MRPFAARCRPLSIAHALAVSVVWVAAEPGTTVAPQPVAELRARIEAHVGIPRFSPALWGIKIVSLNTGQTWYEHHADRLLSPASNCKLYVGALALDLLGPDYRIVTPIFATTAPDASGTVAGDVIVSGRGDPSWKARGTGRKFADIFEPFVTVLQKAGVRHVRGDIVADATFFRGPPNGAGWTADDLDDYYGAEISAISLEQNYAEMRVAPAAPGEPARLTLLHPATGLELDNRAMTVAAGAEREFHTRRLFGENVVHVFGRIPADTPAENVDLTVPAPARWFAQALREVLIQRGIRVDGSARHRRWPDPPAVNDHCTRLGEVSSPPLRELVASFMKASQNLETDLVFGHVGENARNDEMPEWRTSEDSALNALREFLRRYELPADEVRFDEGSGLSRNNLASANATVALLKFMASHPAAKDYIDSLPVAGIDGTLRRRMKATVAENNVRAKTGTLRWSNSLSGYVTTAAGERLVFSLMLNRAVMPPGRNAREDLDAIAVMLASFGGREEPSKSAVTGSGN
ncbi:MAG: D-alanyl-D-alanine carboxypeptidase/D-alanyl-D-alanine-endopeptidase [Opitutaceae bacterium]|nr:D-alanyl-D-alanine carboxypeptidase/D-alanyl-D-alanine-endopeptidase [Opitutaceae bacterium]